MTHLTPNLVAVPVPIGATDFDFINTHTKVLTHSLGQVELGLPTLDKFRFLGLCTSSGPEFETSLDVLSLMQKAGCWFENPRENPNATSILGSSPSGSDYEVLDELNDLWTAAQSQTSPKWAILEKI